MNSPAAEHPPSMNSTGPTTRHRVLHLQRIDEDLFVLELERHDLAFVPGDCVALHSESGVSRPYSIASGDGEATLRFLVRELPGGAVSSWLGSRKPGDVVRVSASFGWFRPGPGVEGAPFVFIATGTGIAPFLSYALSRGRTPPERILYGVRKKAHAIGHDLLQMFCPVQLAVSRETVPGHRQGRVTDLLSEWNIRRDTQVYLCGLESMINEVGERLQALGIDLFNIHREVFFHE